MRTQQAPTALEAEIQEFAATLHLCFRGASWDVVNYYAALTWNASDRSDLRWSEVKSRVRIAWEAPV